MCVFKYCTNNLSAGGVSTRASLLLCGVVSNQVELIQSIKGGFENRGVEWNMPVDGGHEV